MGNRRISILGHLLLFMILGYRYTLSPIIGGQCRFYPTCSHYAETAIKEYGAVKGFYIAIKRLFHCHPWSQGGYDPVPQKNQIEGYRIDGR